MHGRIAGRRDVYFSVLRISDEHARFDSRKRLPVLAEVSKRAARGGLRLHGAASRVHAG
jgi:hypothetical protein